jgi:hypothetical protein
MVQFVRAGCLLILPLVVSQTPSPPVWPTPFSAEFVETTWSNGGMQQHNGSIAYDYANRIEVIRRQVSELNPICNEVKPNRTSPCNHHIVGASRYLYWPEEDECCLHCTKNCGVLRPDWVTAVPYYYTGKRVIAGASCETWFIQSGTPDRFAATVDGDLCELYDGGAGFTGDNPFQLSISPASYQRSVNPQDVLLPKACSAQTKC